MFHASGASIHAASKASKCEHTYEPAIWDQLWYDANDIWSDMQSRNVNVPNHMIPAATWQASCAIKNYFPTFGDPAKISVPG